MISVEKEIQIRLLLEDGIPRKKIAKKVGVSRETVDTIRKAPKLRSRNWRRSSRELKKSRTPRKCPECGAKVWIWPCLLCHPETGG